ncbi:hypothetical protein ACEPPN_017840 [Leptodophora sp. 'Broadleaf-Isolate-01']
MHDGDRSGLVAFRDWSAYIGVVRSDESYSVIITSGVTISTGTTVAKIPVKEGKIWLRGKMDTRSAGSRLVSFEYSLNGRNYRALGTNYTMNVDWTFFAGCRWGIFNFATKELGGSVTVSSFTQTSDV